MNVASPIPTAPDDRGAVFDAVADALTVARTYAIRCAAASLETAAALTTELRPSLNRGGLT